MKQNILYLLLLPLIFASCSNDEGDNLNDYNRGKQIILKIGFAGESNSKLKVTTDNNFKSTWENGDKVGVFIVKGSRGLQSTNYADNIEFTYNDGTWSTTTPQYYPNDEDNLHFYAYYPYDAAMSNPTNSTFGVKTDQRAAIDYSKSDLLLAQKMNVGKSNSAVGLQFSHALSLLQIEVERGENIPAFANDLAATLTNVKPDITVGWGGALTATGAATNVMMYKVAGSSYTYRALVPAQALTAESDITLEQSMPNGKMELVHQGLRSAMLTTGIAHNYKITPQLYINPDHQYSIGDVYPYVGTVIGVVYEISNGGKNGKIVGLDLEEGIRWANIGFSNTTEANNFNNGLVNMKKIYNLSSTFSDYPVFAWVHTKNSATETYSNSNAKGVWYLPALNEFKSLYDSRITVDETLQSIGGTLLGINLYWSSTEYLDNQVYFYSFYNGIFQNSYKHIDYMFYARCVSAF